MPVGHGLAWLGSGPFGKVKLICSPALAPVGTATFTIVDGWPTTSACCAWEEDAAPQVAVSERKLDNGALTLW